MRFPDPRALFFFFFFEELKHFAGTHFSQPLRSIRCWYDTNSIELTQHPSDRPHSKRLVGWELFQLLCNRTHLQLIKWHWRSARQNNTHFSSKLIVQRVVLPLCNVVPATISKLSGAWLQQLVNPLIVRGDNFNTLFQNLVSYTSRRTPPQKAHKRSIFVLASELRHFQGQSPEKCSREDCTSLSEINNSGWFEPTRTCVGIALYPRGPSLVHSMLFYVDADLL